MLNTIKSYIAAYERRCLDDCMSCVSSDPRAMAYGTGADEKCVGPDAIRGQFKVDWANVSSVQMKITWHHAVEHGDTGWVVTDLTFRLETPRCREETAARATFCMVRAPEAGWLIEHMHFSVPNSFALDRPAGG